MHLIPDEGNVHGAVPLVVEHHLKKHDIVVIEPGVMESACGGKHAIERFGICRKPVTNREYFEFVKATREIPPVEWFGNVPSRELLDHPVVGVTMEKAASYASWAGLRLATVLEWEAAARLPDGRLFPWGDEWDPSLCHCRENGAFAPGDTGAYEVGRAATGCLDMVGNVWEWTVEDPRVKSPDPGYAWVMGGSYRHSCVKDGHIARASVSQSSSYGYLGFRCACDLR